MNPSNNLSRNYLSKIPDIIYKYKEIAVHYQKGLKDHFNNLSKEEIIFIYYIYRASLVGNKIAIEQNHRTGNIIINLFENIYNNQNILLQQKDSLNFDINKFIEEIKIFLVYLWTNHGQYFAKEFINNKKTPSNLDLNLLTYKNLKKVINVIDCIENVIDDPEIYKMLFNNKYQPTLVVSNNIEKSAVNYYSSDFTDELFYKVPIDIRSKINVYFYVNNQEPAWKIWSLNSKYGKEIDVAIYWLEKAQNHSQDNPKYFDKYTPESLKHLINFLKTGEEKYFKDHFISWLNTNNKIDYSFGFIENYQDPKSYRGAFQAEITIKTINIETLNKILPKLEEKLPFDPIYKRDSINQIPNASINTQVFGTGDLGPMKIVAAYCLPNYEDIRCNYGSKQIIYQSEPSLGALLNPELNNQLKYTQDQSAWLEVHDKDNNFLNDLWNIHCILHETVGHASSKLGYHKFKSGDKLTIESNQYKVGDQILVNHSNIKELLNGHDQSLEELRAEIIALYISIEDLDDLIKKDLLKGWDKKLNKIELQEWLILEMAYTGLRRLLFQQNNTTEICGDHARANYTILNYLIDNGGLSLIIENKNINNINYKIPGLKIKDLEKAKFLIKKLLIKVQEIKSTGDGQEADKLLKQYGITLKSEHKDIIIHLKNNNKILVGEIKATACIYPKFEAIIDNNINNKIIDIKASLPKDIFEQFNYWNKISYSKDLF